jgi:transposase
MHLDTIRTTRNGKQYVCHLLRETYRQKGKVKHRTVANLSHCPEEEIEAIRLALKHKGALTELASLKESLAMQQGLSVGAVFVLHGIAKRLGIVGALGPTQEGKRALWQVLARVIDQGSRLSAVRLAGVHAACDVLGLEPFDEDNLYENLDWLVENQSKIEDRLFRKRHHDGQAPLFLYDVTSSYLEGRHNALAAFGYSRDGKRGKAQIVIGLLCDEEGWPVSVEVFAGNTADTRTFGSQVRKTADRFGGGPVTLVGDRGLIKGPQIELLQQQEQEFHFITAITKPEIESRLASGLLQMELFDERLAEVIDEQEGVRYVLRRNPLRAEEVAATRRDKQSSVETLLQQQNAYLRDHPRSRVETAVRKVEEKIGRLRLSGWLQVSVSDRRLSLQEDRQALAEESKLDGCYCLKTDLAPEVATKERVHERYKSLSEVEWAFRTCKTAHLEARPIYVRKESRTRGHVFVVMLAYLIVAELARCWQAVDLTVEEGIQELSTLCMTEVTIAGKTRINEVPTPRASIKRLLQAAGIRLPKALPYTGASVSSKKKLPEERKPR